MPSIELTVDGAFLSGRVPWPTGTLDVPAIVIVEVGGSRAEAVVDRFDSVRAGLTGFLHRLPRPGNNATRHTVSAFLAGGEARGSVVWNAGAVALARWLHDILPATTDANPDALPRLSRRFVRYLWLHPFAARANHRTVATFARDAGMLLAARGRADDAARLLSSPLVLQALSESDIATYETLRIIADAASWPAKRPLETAMCLAAHHSPTVAGFSARMRIAAHPDAAAIADLEALAADRHANPVLRGFSAEALLLHRDAAGRRYRDD